MIGLTLDDEWGKDETIYIYAIYQIDNDPYFYGTDKQIGGELYAFRQSEIKIIDPSISFDTVYFSKNEYGHSDFIILHWALAENDLLDRVTDRDEDAIESFSKLRFVDRKP